jgi:hypothetical protein
LVASARTQNPSGRDPKAAGAAEKIKRENNVHLRQLAKKSTYLLCPLFPPLSIFYCFFGRFSIRGPQKRDKKFHEIVRQNFAPDFRPNKGQEAPKKKKEKSDVLPTYLFLRFFEIFRSDFRKYFYGVLGLLIQRNGQKRDKKNQREIRQEKSFFLSTFNFFGQKFLTWTSPKKFLWCF